MTTDNPVVPFRRKQAAKAAANAMQAQLAAYPAELDALSPRAIMVQLVGQHLRNALAERLMFETGTDPLGKPFPVPIALRPDLLAAKDRQIAKIRVALQWAETLPAVFHPAQGNA